MKTGGGSVTTVDVRAEKERPEGDGGRQECFLCVWGAFISPVSSQNSTINLEIVKAAVPPSGAAVQPETSRCNLDVRLHLYSGAQTFICTGIARACS